MNILLNMQISLSGLIFFGPSIIILKLSENLYCSSIDPYFKNSPLICLTLLNFGQNFRPNNHSRFLNYWVHPTLFIHLHCEFILYLPYPYIYIVSYHSWDSSNKTHFKCNFCKSSFMCKLQHKSFLLVCWCQNKLSLFLSKTNEFGEKTNKDS